TTWRSGPAAGRRSSAAWPRPAPTTRYPRRPSMPADHADPAAPDADGVRAPARAAVLRVAALLGWRAAEAAAFAEALCGRPFDDVDAADLARVADEYEAIARAVVARSERPGRGPGGGRHARRA